MHRWPLHKTYFWETAPFFRALLPFIGGILAYSFLPLGLITALLLLIASFGLYAYTALLRESGNGFQPLRFGSLMCTLFFAAWLLSYSNDIRNDKKWFGHKVNTADFFQARITSAPQETEQTYRLSIDVIGTMTPQGYAATKGTAFVYVPKDVSSLHKGDTLLLPNRWKPISNAGNPGEFDYAAYAARNNIYYRMYAPAKEVVLFAHGTATDIGFTERAHDWCMATLAAYIHDSSTLGLVQSMLIGDEVNLNNEIRDAYAATGIIHVIAISGANVSIFFLLISWLFFWLRHRKYHWLKYIIALPLVWFYVIMAGASPSAIRAAVMFMILAVGISMQKSNNSLNQLFATAFILLCAQPMWLYSLGFQLSFVAVLSLILFYKPLSGLYRPGNIIVRTLWQTIVASAAAEILVAPLVIYYFHIFPLLFLVANVAAYLFMGLVLILGLSVLVFSLIPAFAQVVAACTVWLTKVFHSIVYTLQHTNPESLYYLQLDSTELSLLYLLIGGLAIYLLHRFRPALFTGLAAAVILISLLGRDQWIAMHQRKLIVYNIGKLSHIEFMEGKTHSVIYTDTAAAQQVRISYATKPAHTLFHAWPLGKPHLAPALLQLGGQVALIYTDSMLQQVNTGNTAIDYLILTHPAAINADSLNMIFHPKTVVLGYLSPSQLDKWKIVASRLPFKLHSITENGAFVLE